jgi:hypothetical protein
MWLAPYAGREWFTAGVLILVLAGASVLLAKGRGALPRLALVSASLVAVVLLLVLRPLWPVFDMAPLAGQLKDLEGQGVPIAHVSAYNDQYQFYGRLSRPLEEIQRYQVDAWFGKNPGGRTVVYLKRLSDVPAGVLAWPYLDGAVALVDAEGNRRLPGKGK